MDGVSEEEHAGGGTEGMDIDDSSQLLISLG